MSDANLLALESPIVQRLVALLPAQWGGVTLMVGSLADVIGRNDLAALCPAVFVMPAGSTPLPSDEDPYEADAISVEEQQWQVVVLVKFVRGTEPLTFASVGQLLAQVYRALHGWRPAQECRPMQYQGMDAPVPAETGVMQFSANFSVIRAFDPDEFQP